jgi:hypothetical protein
MDEMLEHQEILIEALSELVLLTAVLKTMGFDERPVHAEALRLARRLREVNRKIDNGEY